MNVVVFGLWHLGCVTAACLAADVVAKLQEGRPPIEEPGLAELIAEGLAAGQLSFTTDAARALAGADVLWVAFDTPVNERDEADVGFVRERLSTLRGLCPR